jgi:hypothetical protein
MNDDIPVGGSVLFYFFAKGGSFGTGTKPSVLVKTIFPDDQFSGQ